MKKVIFSLALLLTCSLLALAQKGISYQAVILDPKPIEIPGQDITGQPFVNGEVSLKFKLFSSTFVQEFEEVHATKTDAYGLVNVLIGSQNPGAFSALVWDINPRSMQVWVSFDNGGTYTKVSEQVLTYSPYALYAETTGTAGKLSGTLTIGEGGTGAKTAANARTNLGLGNVDNTSDANKPVSIATQNALDAKANELTTYVNNQVAAIPDANAATKGKIQLAGDLGGTAAAPTVPGLSLKADAATVNAALNLKANAADVTNELALKADAATVNAALNLKANAIDVTNELALKANAAETRTLLREKEIIENKSIDILADAASDSKYPTVKSIKTYVDTQVAAATIADANASTKGKIQLAGDLAGTAAAPTVPGLALKANASEVTAALAAKADTAYVLTKVAAATIADASSSTKGKIQLAGDLAGTAAAPTVPGLALKANTADVTSALALKANISSLSTVATTGDYNDLSNKPTIPSAYSLPTASASVVGGIKVGANLSIDANGVLSAASSSNASSLSGVVPVANGGTGATTIAGIKTALGLNSSSVAIGDQAGQTSQGTNAIAVGLAAGQNVQGANSVAIGSYAGQSQAANSIAINATGSALNPTTTGFYVAPIRNASSSSSLFYNTATKEITYGTASSSSPGVPYTGATGQVDLGAYNLTVNGITVGKGVNSIGSNVAVGVSALGGTGNFNTAFGNNVLASSSQTGIYNNAFGFYSLNMNTTGRDNTAMGTTALYRNTTGESNSAFGNQALGNSVTGSNNTALGYQPLYLNTSGSDNTATGYQALKGNTIGSFNTAVGKFALNANVDGNYNTAIGNSADVASATLTNATAIGNGAIVSASNSIQLGNSAVTNVKTSGTLTAGAVTYPKVHGTANQVLATTGSGTLTWTSITSGGGDASTLTGVVSVANGGTGTTTLTGLVKGNGTGAMTAAVAGTDYLTPTGSAANLTNFPILNQSTTGNAATATLATSATSATTAGNITATSNTTLTSLSNLTTVGTITTGTWSGTAIAVANGGTGATTLTANNVLLGNGTSPLQAVAPGASGNVLTSNGTTWTSSAPSGGSGSHYVGESYGGGVVFYTWDNGNHGLIASTSDLASAQSAWIANTTIIKIKPLFDYDGLLAGKEFTRALVYYGLTGSANYLPTTNTAAYLCYQYRGGNFSDWYLPSAYELELLWQNRNVVGNLASTWTSSVYYWSSTLSSDDGSASVQFKKCNYLGVINGSAGYDGLRVRAIRSF